MTSSHSRHHASLPVVGVPGADFCFGGITNAVYAGQVATAHIPDAADPENLGLADGH
ncbi:hypothetical protein [Streptacidiphilus sp. MAP5-52]|uniref:hypothetical protein n=1 Tax=Streptacidiphilus sp. MAP5-52 TaxID=3156267 RepID=UPI003518E9BA